MLKNVFSPIFFSRRMSHVKRNLDPEQVVEILDRHIIGQSAAKRAVAVALRNRHRRRQLSPELQKEIIPANILMKGPTGCGKTEVARRIATFAQAPFVKVEATRYTEVGIVGANTNSMIADLMEVAISEATERAKESIKDKANEMAANDILRLLGKECNSQNLHLLVNGVFDSESVVVTPDVLTASRRSSMPGINGGRMGTGDLEDVFTVISAAIPVQFFDRNRKNSKKSGDDERTPVKEALKLHVQYHTDKLVDEAEVLRVAKEKTEQEGIVFIDEIDKLAYSSDSVSSYSVPQHREGVQKELLSLLEGCLISTRFGPISTNHILFIGSGAFHKSAISDLLPELQGRLPVRVELLSLDEEDLRRILVEKKYNLVEEVTALLGTEGLHIEFTECAISEIAKVAFSLNNTKGNIGARRLTAVMNAVVEEISFLAHRLKSTTQTIDKAYVQSRMKSAKMASEENLSKYIL